MTLPIAIVIRCSDTDRPRVQYIIDSMFMALDIPVRYSTEPPSSGPWLLYAEKREVNKEASRCVYIPYQPMAWSEMDASRLTKSVDFQEGIPRVLGGGIQTGQNGSGIGFDLFANAFWLLSSWSERRDQPGAGSRGLYSDSVFEQLKLPQDAVDIYLDVLRREINACCRRECAVAWPRARWADGSEYAIVLSHDVDFIPANQLEVVKQGVKTLARHLLRERKPMDAVRAGIGLARAVVSGRDPYGCLPEMIAREKALDVQASYQVAVGHRHPVDVNYHIENDRIRDYLRVITDNDFELCLHGSYRSTENTKWYAEEVELLSERLERPIGSRQHFLSFDYDAMFDIQERTGIQFDMSMGYPDRIGARAGFSFPYFPWNFAEERPYNVLEISLFLMDVTLRSYMHLRAEDAWGAICDSLESLRKKRGGVSVVWHPIVFGDARDPGYGDLFWRLIDRVRSTNGLATDGRSVNDFWRQKALNYPSFSGLA